MNNEPNPLNLVQRSDFRTRIERDLHVAYAAAQAEGYYQGQPTFRINGAACFCKIDVQHQHPEHDGIVRQVVDRTGRVLSQSLKADWAALIAQARAVAAPLHA